MTREELLQELDGIVPKNPKSDWSIYQRKIVDEAIKALEQEPILDKIIAEIEQQERWLMYAGYNAYNVEIAFSSIRHICESEKTDGTNKQA